MSFEKTLIRKTTLAAEGDQGSPQRHRVRGELTLFFVYREIPKDENKLSKGTPHIGLS
jgi:hypothetical protein